MGAKFCTQCHHTYNADVTVCPQDGSLLKDVPVRLPEVGTIIGDRYLIHARLGEGGMGAIYRAQDIRGRREVALKVLKPALTAREQAVARFFHEVRAAVRLHHPNIVNLFDFGVSRDGYLFLAMELLSGGTIGDLLVSRNRLTVGEAMLVASRVCDALVHAHDAGVVHRDIKPENIFLVPWDDDGYLVKVLDFGVAALAFSGSRGALHGGEVLGTPAYMSPEQVRGDVVDPRSDLYSLGIVLFEMLSGMPPFSADKVGETMRHHLTTPPPELPLLAVPDSIRKALDELIAGLLSKDVAERPQTAVEVRRRIATIMDLLAVEDAEVVSAQLFRDTLSPLRRLKNLQLSDLATPLVEEPSLRSSSLPKAPWTVQFSNRDSAAPNATESVRISLVHIEFDFEYQQSGNFSTRTLFAPEREAFEAKVMGDGGCICLESGDELRVAFGLYGATDEPWVPALEAAEDVVRRTVRFSEATGFVVHVRAGVVTDRISADIARSPSHEVLLRVTPADVALRLARMAVADSVVLDDETKKRTKSDIRVDDLGQIRVRGREKLTRIFGWAGIEKAG